MLFRCYIDDEDKSKGFLFPGKSNIYIYKDNRRLNKARMV